ncbi:MAG: type I methionyl aminopeptidase [Candidatus Subteraquimicrobiales bacterium]|nr:type I methionyl aminopeptidase [Candidatus Subteraquimicrobiales bacterium]
MIICKSRREIELMRETGRIVAEALEEAQSLIKPGVKTKDIDNHIENLIRKRKGEPAFKGYRGFPAASCISINEGVVHGIPGEHRLKEGDIVSIDVGVKFKGYFGDAARTFPVGNVSKEALRLIEVTRQALDSGIYVCRVGNRVSDISHAVQTVAERAGYSVVRDFVGHGIGQNMHEDPPIPNYGKPGQGSILEEGMVFAIEPMVNAGDYQVEVLPDGWAVVAKDKSLSAHFEHTVAITTDGPMILTIL